MEAFGLIREGVSINIQRSDGNCHILGKTLLVVTVNSYTTN